MKFIPTYESFRCRCNDVLLAGYFKIKPSKVVRFFLAFLLITLSIVSSPFHAQELVPDPSFEIQNCENSPELEYWFNPNTATPDLMTIEGCGILLNDNLYNLGYAPPFEGNQYIGIFCAEAPEVEYQTREYVSTELLAYLQNGVTYQVQFKIRRLPYFNLAIDKIGVLFTQYAPILNDGTILPYEPQLETEGSILQSDSLWVSIDFNYLANGSEKFLTIGNFRPPQDMNVVNTGTSPDNSDHAYYMVDEIHVQGVTSIQNPLKANLVYLLQENSISVMNPTNHNACILVYDILGHKLLTFECPPTSQINVPFQNNNAPLVIQEVINHSIRTAKFFRVL